MKKAVLLGVALMVTSGAILIANNNAATTETCCDRTKCEQSVCRPADQCQGAGACCEQKD